MSGKILYIAKCLLGVLFILSAVLKFISIDAFERYLFSFTLFSFNFCSFAARRVIAAESLIGFAFILNYRHKLLCRITAVVLAVFSCFLLYLVFVGNEGNCHCFGEVIDMRPEESLSKNVGLAILLAVVWRYSGKKEILSRWLAHIVFVAVFIAPFIFFCSRLFCTFWPEEQRFGTIGISSRCRFPALIDG